MDVIILCSQMAVAILRKRNTLGETNRNGRGLALSCASVDCHLTCVLNDYGERKKKTNAKKKEHSEH